MFEVNCSDAAGVVLGECAVMDSTAIEFARDLRAVGVALAELLSRIESHIDEQHIHAQSTSDVGEMQRLQDADPYRWLADAKHSLQAGAMFAGRAVAQPVEF